MSDLDPDVPACWSWPIHPEDRASVAKNGTEGLRRWHTWTCGLCGKASLPLRGIRTDELVLDHDHDTGLARGYLCRSCNRRETYGRGAFDLWRSCPSAALFGLIFEYDLPQLQASDYDVAATVGSWTQFPRRPSPWERLREVG